MFFPSLISLFICLFVGVGEGEDVMNLVNVNMKSEFGWGVMDSCFKGKEKGCEGYSLRLATPGFEDFPCINFLKN